MKKRNTVKNLTKVLILWTLILLCVFGISACTNKPETATVTVEQLIEANDRQKVIEEYGNLHVTETTTYESGAVYTANALYFKMMHGISKSFGHGTGFTVGLVLLPFIFQLVLGFGSSEYRPVNKGKSK